MSTTYTVDASEVVSELNTGEHPAKTVFRVVQEEMAQLGYQAHLIDTLQCQHPGLEHTGLNLRMSDDLGHAVREAKLGFTVTDSLDGYFGTPEDKNVTTARMELGLGLRETLRKIDMLGGFETGLERIEAFRSPGDPAAETVLVYAVATYVKGWLAEEAIQRGTEEFKKGSASNDAGGIDFYRGPHTVQLKSITFRCGNEKEARNSEQEHWQYQWDSDGRIHVARHDRALKMNKKVASRAGLPSTMIRRTMGTSELKAAERIGRRARFLWW